VSEYSPANKYRAKKVEIDGIIFDSGKEAEIYTDLKKQKANGDIKDFAMQVTFELIPKQTELTTVFDKKGLPKQKDKVVENAVKYIADFVVYHHDGEVAIVDPKGKRTKDYVIKRKLMLFRHRIKIKEI
jgi:hypothetical protein